MKPSISDVMAVAEIVLECKRNIDGGFKILLEEHAVRLLDVCSVLQMMDLGKGSMKALGFLTAIKSLYHASTSEIVRKPLEKSVAAACTQLAIELVVEMKASETNSFKAEFGESVAVLAAE